LTEVAYLDASALVKLVIDEKETAALSRFVGSADRFATSRVGIVETTRAAARRDRFDRERLDRVLLAIEVIELDDRIARGAASIGPPTLRTLDAIHLASARELGSELEALVTYDVRLADAARSLGLPVVSPG
jgi:predicted nucleic acid-binding protein